MNDKGLYSACVVLIALFLLIGNVNAQVASVSITGKESTVTNTVEVQYLDTWLFAGQSNSEGYGITENPVPGLAPATTLADIGRSDLNQVNDNVLFFKGFGAGGTSAGMSVAPVGIWHNMLPYKGISFDWGTGIGKESGRRFGSELSFGKEMTKNGEKIAIVKFAVGSTPIASSNKQRNDGSWHDFDPNDGGRLNQYDKLLTTVSNAVNSLPENVKLRFRGVIWMQGENDAKNLIADKYETNLTEFIDILLSDLSDMASINPDKMEPATTWDELKYFIGTIATPGVNGDKVRTAQYAVAESKGNVYTVTANTGLPFLSNDDWSMANVHYNTEGQVILGERFAAAVLAPEEDNETSSNSGIIHQKSGFKVFPTVTDSSLSIQMPEELKKGTVTIHSISGNLIEKKVIPISYSGTYTIDVASYNAGMYIISLQNKTQRIECKFVKQ
ncbi:T9SS type A sorting domain-containing protein [Labilibacter sediminis]|nr:T9SS type A sorting domain-containing protein [Labilibacter sediminis]